jgi:hypothetical protein
MDIPPSLTLTLWPGPVGMEVLRITTGASIGQREQCPLSLTISREAAFRLRSIDVAERGLRITKVEPALNASVVSAS